MKRILTTALVAGLGVMAMAQSPSFIPTNTNIRLGFVYPTEDAVRDFTGNMFGLGVDIDTNFRLVSFGHGFLSLDYYTSSLDGEKGRVFSAMYNQRMPLSSMDGRNTYYFVGAGITNVDFTTSKTVFGLRGGVGMSLSEKTYGELVYNFTEKVDGVRASNFGVYLGFKF